MKQLTDIEQALAYISQRRYKFALRSAKSAQKKHPSAPMPFNVSGIALASLGDHRAAIACFSKALKLDPAFADARRNLVQSLIFQGRHDTALAQLEKLIRIDPEDAGSWYLLASLEMQRAEPQRAVEAATKAISVAKAVAGGSTRERRDLALSLSRSYNIRGVAHQALAQDDLTFEDYQTSLDLNPDNPETLSNISVVLSMRLRPEDGLAALERALAIDPHHVNALQRYGIQLNEAGRTEEAIAVYHRLLDVAPFHAEGLRELSRLQDAAQNATLRPRLVAAASKVPKISLDRALLAFGMAQIAEQAGEQTEAERLYAQANRLTAGLRPYDRDEAQAEEADIFTAFPADYAGPGTVSAKAPTPIFVLGQPRSGTTLVEQVLSAHPDIRGAGEQPMAGRLARSFRQTEGAFGTEAARAFADAYLLDLPDMDPAPCAFVDKMPANYKLIGFLATAFPDAPILHIRRDPRDVAWSMWRSWFPNGPMNYTFDMVAMADEANAYVRYMAHWHRLFPGRIHDFDYEEIVTDIDRASRHLAQLCGVNWRPDMAAPERNRATVRTASVNQVRAGVHQRSVGGWRSHAEVLRPFIDRLDPALWPGLD